MAVATDLERAHWVVLSMAAGIGPVRFRRLLDVCGGAQAAWTASDLDLHAAGLERRTINSLKRLRERTSPQGAVDRLARLGISVLTLLDDTYPPALREIVDPPPVLFTRGALAACDDVAVAMVGTREATAYGRSVALRLVSELVAAGVTIVSGLARGIDTVVHGAAVEAGGRTLAVLGNGLDQVYPVENGRLAQRIIDTNRGALVSEFAPGIPPDAVNFPRRNRIIAGLCRVTVIVEADTRSGALITADFALEQGREVMAVPGSILSRFSTGTNELIKQGAAPVTCAQDNLNALDMAPCQPVLARAMPELADQDRRVWDALHGDPRHADELARTLGLSAGAIAVSLTNLELEGLARQVGTMLYTRA